MRTTLTIEERIARDLKEIAHRTGKPFKVVVNETLRAGLAAAQRPTPWRYRIRAVSLGGVRPGINLDKALALADALEEEQLTSKIKQGK
jgi:predicted DNA-binding ribbon-helix-helix protein